MAQDERQWQATAHFYTQLFACVWQQLAPYLGAATTLDLLALATATLAEAYPFLTRLVWRPEGLEAESFTKAIADEPPAHVQAGCERLLQELHGLVQTMAGSLLAQRLVAATERLRLAFDPALSLPTPAEELEEPPLPAEPRELALPLLHSVARQAVQLYRRLQAQEAELARLRQERESLRQTPDLVARAAEVQRQPEHSEAFYHTLFELSPDGVIVTTIDGTILQANPRVAEILEVEHPDALVGRNVIDFYVHPEERDALLEQIYTRQRVEGQRRELHTQRGRRIIVMASTSLIDYRGQPCLLSVMRDVTERARLRQEMEDFAYSASHDLQAPLRTFEGYARWLLEDYGHLLDSTGRQLCQEIIDEALHMKKLLDGLLEYSRIGREHTQAVEVDVRAVLEQVLHDLQLEIAETGARIELPESLPRVYYPEVRLVQVFSNLLSNALKFTGGKTPEIVIGCSEQGRYYRFSVSDNGIGIAPEHFGRIFEIFKRLHPREQYPGTGAGLTIVKKIVEAHGGQIGVESTPGQGSTFWFTIPKPEPAGDATADRAAG